MQSLVCRGWSRNQSCRSGEGESKADAAHPVPSQVIEALRLINKTSLLRRAEALNPATGGCGHELGTRATFRAR
ncbi:protein of unknown function [Hyphomicrobium sp. MC1]|nr:protein of unknown function [Hyphomicrobium sp. MC1]